jgi:hypothetical protein
MRTAKALGLMTALLFSCVCAAAQVKPKSNVAWFNSTEQALMDALAPGNKAPWQDVMDEGCLVTDEEGRVVNKEQFLSELRALPTGLSCHIAVRDLTVQEFATFAVGRFVADEWESVFGQRLTTKDRFTDTFRRAGSAWKMVAWQAAVVTADPSAQPALAGRYKLLPNGWKFYVAYREGKLYGGRDPAKLKPLIPLTPDAFVLQGSLGEWMFVTNQQGKPTHILNLRKFEPLVWSRIPDTDQ